MKLVLVFAALAATVIPAAAQGFESMQTATSLGTVLAAEEFCDLSFDQSAISAYIESKVPADDMSFPSTLQMMVQGSEFQQKEMSKSAKTAHCTQVARIAKSYGFTE